MTDGQIGCDGVNNTWLRPAIETIAADVQVGQAFRIAGHHQVLIDPVIAEVDNVRAAVGFWVNQRTTIVNPVIWGRQYPDYPFQFNDDGSASGSGSASTIIAERSLADFVSGNIRRLLHSRGSIWWAIPRIITAATN